MRPARILLITTLLLLQMIPAFAQYRAKFPLPSPAVPETLGVNIHFNDPKRGEMEQLAAAGFHWIRQDFGWASIERVRGKYDFSAYDRLMAALKPHHIRPIFILDYGNDLYQKGAPRSPEAVAAFARFAAAGVAHFRGQGVLWEMWNEPNGSQFWAPRESVEEYIRLALATGKAIRDTAPEEWYIGPATSGMDFDFIGKCFQAGLLQYWDAVSFHPYRNSDPESAAPDFMRVRGMIARYGPPGKAIPILSGEWGYSELYPGLSLEKQSRYIAREFLSNIANGLILSIWYDWHDDGTDPKEIEHHFGTVYNNYKPKPTYQAVKTLSEVLDGCRFNKRLTLDSPDDYCLLFSRGNEARLAVWTTASKLHEVRLPAAAGKFQVIGYTGTKTEATAKAEELRLQLTDAPQYIVPIGENALLGMALRWNTLPLHVLISTPEDAVRALNEMSSGAWTAKERAEMVTVSVVLPPNPGHSHRMNLIQILGSSQEKNAVFRSFIQGAGLPFRSDTPYPVWVALQFKSGGTIAQQIVFTGQKPLRIVAQPAAGNRMPVRIDNPTGAAFTGRIRLDAQDETKARNLVFQEGQTEQSVMLPVEVNTNGEYTAGIRVEERFPPAKVWTVVSWTPTVIYIPLETFAAYPLNAPLPESDYRVLPDGDPKVKSTIKMRVVEAPPGLTAGPKKAVRIDYDFSPGWKFLRLEPEKAKREPLAGKPYGLGMWVHGDGSGDVLNARYTDASGQTFQPTAGHIDWKGWRYIIFNLQGKDSGHWSGANDGIIHYPIHMDTLLLVDSLGGRGGSGTIYAAGLTVITDAVP